MKYRPEIDGLRAIAVLPVIFFHAGFPVFSGGFVGVDVFFVISGYLITGIIRAELTTDTFSIGRFYERRARRILPALFAVMITCIPFAWAWMLPQEMNDFSRSMVAVVFFFSNVFFSNEVGYFLPQADIKPLLHTWSLAVEEQFYLAFPLLMVIARRLQVRTIIAMILAVSALSLALAETSTSAGDFFLLRGRAWELGVGAVLSLTSPYWHRISGNCADLLAAIGLAAIGYAVFGFDATVRFPGVWTLVPVLGTATVIACTSSATRFGRLLAAGPLVGTGLISYSAYLWHQPLFAFARIRSLSDIPTSAMLALIALSMILAWLTWRLIEMPVRKRGRLPATQLFGGAILTAAALVAFGLAGNRSDGFPGRLPAVALEMAKLSNNMEPKSMECHQRGWERPGPDDKCRYGDDIQPAFAILGDSHAAALSAEMARGLAARGQSLQQLTLTSCPPSPGLYRPGQGMECPAYNNEVQSYLSQTSSPRTLIMAARWPLYLEGDRFNNQEGGIEAGTPAMIQPVAGSDTVLGDNARIAVVGGLIRDAIQRQLDNGKRVVLIYPVPEAGWDVPIHLAREHVFGITRTETLSTSYAVYAGRVRDARTQLDLLPDHPNLIRVDPARLVCNTILPDRCVTEIDGQPLYFDDDHPNDIGAGLIADLVMAEMLAKGWLNRQD